MTDFQKICFHKLELDLILDQLQEFAILPRVQNQIASLVPSQDITYLEEELSHVDECLAILRRCERAPIYLSSAYEKLLSVLKKDGILSGEELYQTVLLYQTIKANQAMVLQLQKNGIPSSFYQSLVSTCVYQNTIEKILIQSVDESGYILDDASPDLKNIRKKLARMDIQVKNKLQEIIGREGNKLSQTSVVLRDNCYCLAVKSEHKNSIKGILHDMSSSMQTCFIEPYAVNELMQEKAKWIEEEKKEVNRIIKNLSHMLAEEVDNLEMNFDIICQLDFVFAKAMLAESYNGFAPQLNQQCELELRNARHPLLKVKKVIPNHISFGDHYLGIIITGPNTGGKTVLLKTVGLLCAMVKYGLLIPADPDSRVMVFDQIFCDIGDDQSIASNLSTFSSHMHNITQIIDQITPQSLVLFDEIGSGTDPIEGSNLAKAILKYLIEHKISFITTTHYSQLKAFGFDAPQVINASMEFDANTLSPTYRLKLGVSGASNALNIAKRLGLKEEIIQDAYQMTITSEDDARKLILKLEQQVKTYEKKMMLLQQERQLLHKKESDYNEKLARVEKERQLILTKAQQDADAFVEKVSKEALIALDAAKELSKGDVKLHQIIETKHKIEQLGGEVEKKQAIPKKVEREAHIGDDVYITTYDQYGVIQKQFKDGASEVAIGNMHLKLKRDQFNVLDKAPVTKGKTGGTHIEKSRASVSLTLDLRGKRYEEAKEALDKYIDDLLLTGLKQASIIHGFGTGVIREMVQSYVKSNPHIGAYRYGGETEGGFGVTVITLK
ncbi:MAG: endonuclease MutS2 [Anaeroplasma bactoclasticum]|nr:endonuclease MutS2 [Anaeroplasma bactoclasticum]